MNKPNNYGSKKPFPSRRLVIGAGVGAVAAAAWWGWPFVAPYLVSDFEFEPVPGVPGFRQIAGGDTSGNINPLAGIEAPGSGKDAEVQEAVRADVRGALFGQSLGKGVVPIASFSDYYCPFCRLLTQKLAKIESEADGRIRITWHEWPLLGSNSEYAARAALAADLQGAYVAFHKRLMRTSFVPTQSFLEALARSIGIDPARMVADIESAAVSKRLHTSKALASVFRFRGTPALVVGTTVIVGAVSDASLQALINWELQEGAS